MRSNSLENCYVASGDNFVASGNKFVASGDNFVTHDAGTITSGDTSVFLTQISQVLNVSRRFHTLQRPKHLTKISQITQIKKTTVLVSVPPKLYK